MPPSRLRNSPVFIVAHHDCHCEREPAPKHQPDDGLRAALHEAERVQPVTIEAPDGNWPAPLRS